MQYSRALKWVAVLLVVLLARSALAQTGVTSADIATILGVSTRTVNQHFENAGRKLGTLNRVHSVATAIRMSLI